jgi:hypothetical protein
MMVASSVEGRREADLYAFGTNLAWAGTVGLRISGSSERKRACEKYVEIIHCAGDEVSRDEGDLQYIPGNY